MSTLTYDISYINKFVRVDVKPNFCNISKSVSVTIEWSFAGTNKWKSFSIEPCNITNISEYHNSSNYIHDDIRSFVQYYKDYTGSAEEVNEKKKEFDNFINNFIINKSLVIRLVVSEVLTEIKQSYYTTI